MKTKLANLLIRFWNGRRIAQLGILFAFALVLELTIWNRAYYAHFWQGWEINDYELQNVVEQGGILFPGEEVDAAGEPVESAIAFENVGCPVNSVYIKPLTDPKHYKDGVVPAQMSFFIIYGDEGTSRRQTEKFNLVCGQPYTYYQEINPLGNVDYIAVMPSGSFFIEDIALNKTIPMHFNFFRVLLMTLLAYAVIRFAKYDAKSEIFDPKNKRQTCLLLAMMLCFLLVHGIVAVSTGVNYQTEPYDYLVDSFLEGRLDLGIEPMPEMLALEDPYDPVARAEAGVPDYTTETLLWDILYKDGKYYLYYGVMPVWLFYLPYHVMTGEYLPNGAAIFSFVAVANIAFAFLWRLIVKRHLPNMPFILYMCSTAALWWVNMSGTLMWALRKYEMVQAAGLMFAAVGTLLLFSAFDDKYEKLSLKKLVFAALCNAMVFGCRQTMAVSSVLMAVMLIAWARKQKPGRVIAGIVCVAIPYIAVAIPLMWYNFARFGDVFEFGFKYSITYTKLVQELQNPMGKLNELLISLKNGLFGLMAYNTGFPFAMNSGTFRPTVDNSSFYYSGYVGLVNFPFLWTLPMLPLVWKRIKDEMRPISQAIIVMFLCSFTLMAMTLPLIGAQSPRYQADYYWMLVIPALIVCYYLWTSKSQSSVLAKVFCAAMILSCFVASLIPSEGVPMGLLKPGAYAWFENLFLPFG